MHKSHLQAHHPPQNVSQRAHFFDPSSFAVNHEQTAWTGHEGVHLNAITSIAGNDGVLHINNAASAQQHVVPFQTPVPSEGSNSAIGFVETNMTDLLVNNSRQDYFLDQAASARRIQTGPAGSQRQPAPASAFPPYSPVRDDPIQRLPPPQVQPHRFPPFPPSRTVYSQTSPRPHRLQAQLQSLASRPVTIPPLSALSALSPVARAQSSSQMRGIAGRVPGAASPPPPQTQSNGDLSQRNMAPPTSASSVGQYGQSAISRERGGPIPQLNEHSPPSSASLTDRRTSAPGSGISRVNVQSKYEKASEHAKTTLKPAMDELHRFTQVLQDTLADELIKINDQHARRLAHMVPDYEKAVARGDELFKLGRYWRDKYTECDGKLANLQKLYKEEQIRCRHLTEDKHYLSARVRSLPEELQDRPDSQGPGNLREINRRIEDEVSRRTADLTEQLTEERAARFVAEQRLKELESLISNSSEGQIERDDEGDEPDDAQDSLSNSLRAIERRRLEKDNVDPSVVKKTSLSRRDSLSTDDEPVRRSAPPVTDVYSEHIRPSLSARSASFMDSAAHTSSAAAVHRSIDSTGRKRQRSFSDDRSLTPSLSKRRAPGENEPIHDLDADPAEEDELKEDDHMEQDNESREDLAGNANKRLGIRHFTLLYNFNPADGYACRLCAIRKEQGLPDAKESFFPANSPGEVLAKHCETVHPEGTENILSMSEAQLENARLKLRTSNRSP